MNEYRVGFITDKIALENKLWTIAKRYKSFLSQESMLETTDTIYGFMFFTHMNGAIGYAKAISKKFQITAIDVIDNDGETIWEY